MKLTEEQWRILDQNPETKRALEQINALFDDARAKLLAIPMPTPRPSPPVAPSVSDEELADAMDKAWCEVANEVHVPTARLGTDRAREARLARARRARELLAPSERKEAT